MVIFVCSIVMPVTHWLTMTEQLKKYWMLVMVS